MIAERLPSARILLVDDEEANLQLLHRILETGGFQNLRQTTDPEHALEVCAEWDPDIVLLDLLMPKLDGFQVLETLRQRQKEPGYLPVMVLTSDHSQEARRRALSGGARDFLTKPLSPGEVRLRVRNLLETRFLYLTLHEHNRDLEAHVLQRTAELERARYELLRRLAQAAEYRDDSTGEHPRRVGESSAAIARALGLDAEAVETLRRVAPLHDVGKIAVPDAVLLWPGPLDRIQTEVMHTHTVVGGELLGGSGFEMLDRAAEIALTHHERWDGLGYPHGRAGEEIPLFGRIVALADVFDALTHRRPYKEAWSVREACVEIAAQSGTRFDPAVVRAFERMLSATHGGNGARP